MKIKEHPLFYMEPNDLIVCNEVIERQGWIFFKTFEGNDLFAIKSEDQEKLFADVYEVKLSLFKKMFGWKDKALKITVE